MGLLQAGNKVKQVRQDIFKNIRKPIDYDIR